MLLLPTFLRSGVFFFVFMHVFVLFQVSKRNNRGEEVSFVPNLPTWESFKLRFLKCFEMCLTKTPLKVLTGVLISPYPDQKGNKLMFLSGWREFPSAPCLAGGKKTWWQLASRCGWNGARPWHASELVSFLVGLRTYQHAGSNLHQLRVNVLTQFEG